jgi:uncharacterized membrane protein
MGSANGLLLLGILLPAVINNQLDAEYARASGGLLVFGMSPVAMAWSWSTYRIACVVVAALVVVPAIAAATTGFPWLLPGASLMTFWALRPGRFKGR